MYKKLQILIIAILLLWSISTAWAEDDHDHDHDHVNEQVIGNDHESDDGHNSICDHEKHDGEAEHDDHDGHSDELIIELTSLAAQAAGISIARAEHGRIGKTIELSGEVGFNEDRLIHIAPRFPGIAMKIDCGVGDYVKAGDVVAIVESNESMSPYSIKAPISGWVIDRHISLGEFVSGENSIFIIADLSTVWVNLAVYPGEANLVRKGQVAEINAIGTKNIATGPIEYITHVVDPEARSLTARVILDNPNNSWRPGTFVRATIAAEPGNESILVESKAVQYLVDKSVVFVVDGTNKFRPVDVVTGDSDLRFTQIVSGLGEGTEYVSEGAFELKAKIVTSNMDAHAGHGH